MCGYLNSERNGKGYLTGKSSRSQKGKLTDLDQSLQNPAQTPMI